MDECATPSDHPRGFTGHERWSTAPRAWPTWLDRERSAQLTHAAKRVIPSAASSLLNKLPWLSAGASMYLDRITEAIPEKAKSILGSTRRIDEDVLHLKSCRFQDDLGDDQRYLVAGYTDGIQVLNITQMTSCTLGCSIESKVFEVFNCKLHDGCSTALLVQRQDASPLIAYVPWIEPTQIRFIDPATHKLKHQIQLCAPILDLQITPREATLLIVASHRQLRIFDAATFHKIDIFATVPSPWKPAFCLTPDNILWYENRSGFLVAHDLRSGEIVCETAIFVIPDRIYEGFKDSDTWLDCGTDDDVNIGTSAASCVDEDEEDEDDSIWGEGGRLWQGNEQRIGGIAVSHNHVAVCDVAGNMVLLLGLMHGDLRSRTVVLREIARTPVRTIGSIKNSVKHLLHLDADEDSVSQLTLIPKLPTPQITVRLAACHLCLRRSS